MFPYTPLFRSSPAKNGAGWNSSDVTLSWSCTDGLSGPVSLSDSAVVTTEGQNQQALGHCAGKAGNSSSSTDGAVNIDKTAPAIHFDGQSPAKNGAGWNNSDVTLSWSCTDGLSGPVSLSDSAVVTTEGDKKRARGHCGDQSSNSGASSDGAVNIDKTA